MKTNIRFLRKVIILRHHCTVSNLHGWYGVVKPSNIYHTEKYLCSCLHSNKSTSVPIHCTKAHRGGGAEVHLHLFLTSVKYGDEWPTSGPGRVAAGTVPRYPLDKSLDGPQGRSGPSGGEKGFCWCCNSNSGQSEYGTPATGLATLTFRNKKSFHEVRKSAYPTAPLYRPVFANTTLTPEVTATGRILYIYIYIYIYTYIGKEKLHSLHTGEEAAGNSHSSTAP